MTPPTPGDVIWAYAGTKTRPCVVLRVVDGAAIVLVAGTSTARDDARVEVVAGSREAARMGVARRDLLLRSRGTRFARRTRLDERYVPTRHLRGASQARRGLIA